MPAIALETRIAQVNNPHLLPEYFQVQYDPQNGILAKEKSDYGKINDLERQLEKAGIPQSARGDIKQNNDSIDYFIQLYSNYVSSGKHEQFSEWCRKNGYDTPQHPKLYAASEQPSEAVAWTNGNKNNTVIGVNKYLESKLREFASNYGLSKEEAIEMVITHELMHNVKNNYVKKNGRRYTEADCEKQLSRYFLDMIQQAKNPAERQKYWKMAKAANQRYNNRSYS